MTKYKNDDAVRVASGPLKGRTGVVKHFLRFESLYVVTFNGIEKTFAEYELEQA